MPCTLLQGEYNIKRVTGTGYGWTAAQFVLPFERNQQRVYPLIPGFLQALIRVVRMFRPSNMESENVYKQP